MTSPGTRAFLTLAKGLLRADAVFIFTWLDEHTAAVRHVDAATAESDSSPRDIETLIVPLARAGVEASGGIVFDQASPRRWIPSTLRPYLSETPAAAAVVTPPVVAGASPFGGLLAAWSSAESAALAFQAFEQVGGELRSAVGQILDADAARSPADRNAERFDAIMAAVRQGVVFVDDESGVGIINPAAGKLLDLPPGTIAPPVLTDRLEWLRRQARSEPGSTARPRHTPVGPTDGASESLWILETPYRCALRVSATPVSGAGLNARVWTFNDVTRETEAELEALRHETRFRSALDGMLDAFFILRAVRDEFGAVADFTFVEMNAEAASLTQTKREALLGLGIRQAFPAFETSGLLELCRKVHESGIRYEGEHQPIDARIGAEWLRLQVVPSGDGVAITSRDITEKKQAEQALREQSLHDELTGLLNRRGFRKIVEHELLVARRTARRDALLFIDLDDFKAINDDFGHAAGDDTLRTVAETLRDTTRQSDLVGRLGGDEFLVYAVDGQGALLANRIVAAIDAENARLAASRGYEIRLSIGVAEIANGEEFDGIMARADSELYAAKRARKPATRVA